MCGSMVDIQSAMAEIRRGKKDIKKIERKEKPQGKNIMSASAMQGGRNQGSKVHLENGRKTVCVHIW